MDDRRKAGYFDFSEDDDINEHIYVYINPHNIKQLIKENPEFKKDIDLEFQNNRDIVLCCLYNKDGSPNVDDCEDLATLCPMYDGGRGAPYEIKNCRTLWKANIKKIRSLLNLISITNAQLECDKIVEEVYKKTGKFY